MDPAGGSPPVFLVAEGTGAASPHLGLKVPSSPPPTARLVLLDARSLVPFRQAPPPVSSSWRAKLPWVGARSGGGGRREYGPRSPSFRPPGWPSGVRLYPLLRLMGRESPMSYTPPLAAVGAGVLGRPTPSPARGRPGGPPESMSWSNLPPPTRWDAAWKPSARGRSGGPPCMLTTRGIMSGNTTCAPFNEGAGARVLGMMPQAT